MRLAVRGVYPPDWKAVSRRVRDEAGWRCVRCFHPFDRDIGKPLACDICDLRRCRHQLITARPRGVFNYGVHHLDGDKGNCRWWNLLALDNACHLSVQARVIPERAWLFDHSLWFIPYVCGFYAHYFGSVEITREQAIAEPARWLAMGQPWRESRPREPELVGEIVPRVLRGLTAREG
jgi:hypothetical protein